MKILITGICGFVGSVLAKKLIKENIQIYGIDNLSREGSKQNYMNLPKIGIQIIKGDIRNKKDLETIPRVDWVIDCAAEPSVISGVAGNVGSYELLDNNLIGTIQLLEFCKKHQSGFILLSTSRVYSINSLSTILVENTKNAFVPKAYNLSGLSPKGINEHFSTEPPLSLYGSSKKCSEILALEYGNAFNIPVWINRCGVLAGRGQFGKIDQGIFSFWIKSWKNKKPLTYIGFNGTGAQVRDCLHPRDLIPVLKKQLNYTAPKIDKSNVDSRICNFSGGVNNSCSLNQLSEWCKVKFGPHHVNKEFKQRQYDLPWVVLDCDRAKYMWDWSPVTTLNEILEEISTG